MVVGDNGVLTQSQIAKKESEEANAKEEIEMAWVGLYSDYLSTGGDRSSYFTKDNLNQYMNDSGTIIKTLYNSDDSIAIEYQRNGSEVIELYVISVNGDVSKRGIYGVEANLGTVIVGSTALTKGWQYFYDDGNNIYLIYADYLENGRIPSGTNISKNGNNVYANSGTNRDVLVDYLKNTTIWNIFSTGVKNALNVKGIATGGITVIGTPTPEMWMDSYNTRWDTTLGAQNFAPGQKFYSGASGSSIEVGTTSGRTSVEGYLYTRDNTASTIKWEDYIGGYMSKIPGYPGEDTSKTNMYYPCRVLKGGTNGYWLARSIGFFIYQCVLSDLWL